jgi:hypothetical protein
MAIPALIATSLEPRVACVHLSGMIVSYRALLQVEDYAEPFANFVPNILRHADLPQIARTVGPRRVSIAGAVDGAGKRVPVDSVRAAYKDLTVIEDSAWNVETLSKL